MTYRNPMTRLSLAILIISVTIALSPNVGASTESLKSPGPRQGYYLSLGTYGTASVLHDNSDNGWLGVWPGAAGSFRMGQGLTDWMDLGIGITGGWNGSSEYGAIQGHLVIEVQLRPIRCRDPFFIRASAGFGFVDISRRKTGLEPILGQASGAYGLFVGVDFFPAYENGSGGFAITPIAGIELSDGDMLTSLTGFIGVEFTFWTGLPRNQLAESLDAG